MKFNKNLMAGLIGLALMAAPITAAAQDQQNRGKTDSHQAQAQSHEPAAHSDRAPAAHSDRAQAAHSDRAQARSNQSERRSAPEAANRNAARDERGART